MLIEKPPVVVSMVLVWFDLVSSCIDKKVKSLQRFTIGRCALFL